MLIDNTRDFNSNYDFFMGFAMIILVMLIKNELYQFIEL